MVSLLYAGLGISPASVCVCLLPSFSTMIVGVCPPKDIFTVAWLVLRDETKLFQLSKECRYEVGYRKAPRLYDLSLQLDFQLFWETTRDLKLRMVRALCTHLEHSWHFASPFLHPESCQDLTC